MLAIYVTSFVTDITGRDLMSRSHSHCQGQTRPSPSPVCGITDNPFIDTAYISMSNFTGKNFNHGAMPTAVSTGTRVLAIVICE